MSEERVGAVRRVYEEFNRTGEPPWELFAPEAEFDATAVPGFGIVSGRDRVLAALRDYAATFDTGGSRSRR